MRPSAFTDSASPSTDPAFRLTQMAPLREEMRLAPQAIFKNLDVPH